MYAGSKCETRFMYLNNLATSLMIDWTEGKVGFPPENLSINSRGTFYIPDEKFYVTNAKKTFKFKIGVGADTTVNLTVGEYTASELATHIQSVFSNGFSVEYVIGTKRFRIKNASNSILYASENLESWDMIGFTSEATVNLTATVWRIAEEVRRHTEIKGQCDLGGSAYSGFFALLGEKNKTFCLSPAATVNIRLSNINDFDSAPININVTPTERGCFTFLDAIADDDNPDYRYFWIVVRDRENVTNDNLVFTHAFLGPYTSFENRTINNGFGIKYQDRSERSESVTGGLYFNRHGRVTNLTNLEIAYLTKDQALTLRQLAYDLGTSGHLYLSLDSGRIYDDPSNLCYYGVFDGEMDIRHEPPIYYNASFDFRED